MGICSINQSIKGV